MSDRAHCPACDGRDLWETETWANGGHGPALLPRLAAFLKPAKVRLVLCGDCGHLSMFAAPETLARLARQAGRTWHRVR